MLLATHQPLDLVIIMLGTNDLKRFRAIDAMWGMERLIEIVQTFPYNELYEKPQLLIIAPPHVAKTDDEDFAAMFANAIEESRNFAYHYAAPGETEGRAFFRCRTGGERRPGRWHTSRRRQYTRARRGAGGARALRSGGAGGDRRVGKNAFAGSSEHPGMSETEFDIIVIGSGPGGYVAAIRAAQLGFKTAVVEREHLGGICLNWGCIPTKALLRTAEIYRYMKQARHYGLTAEKVGLDPAAIVKRSREVAGRLNGGVSFLLGKNKVPIIWGEAKIGQAGRGRGNCLDKDSPWRRRFRRPRVRWGRAPIAQSTSSSPPVRDRGCCRAWRPTASWCGPTSRPWCPAPSPSRCWSSGSGAIGIEFASFFNAMGSDVTVVEIVDQIMPVEDAEIAKIARKQLEKQGLKIKTGAKVEWLEKGRRQGHRDDRAGCGAKRDHGRPGHLRGRRRGQHRKSGARGSGRHAPRRARSSVDGFGRTNVPGVYAIGDVAGPPMLAHKAEHEGVICVEKHQGPRPPCAEQGADSRAAPIATRRSPPSA